MPSEGWACSYGLHVPLDCVWHRMLLLGGHLTGNRSSSMMVAAGRLKESNRINELLGPLKAVKTIELLADIY